MSYNCIQTFYVDPSAVNNSPKVFLTSVQLFFKAKPKITNNSSGISNPGVTIYICGMSGENPNPEKLVPKTTSRREYNDVLFSQDATSPTVFRFSAPVAVETGKYYGIVIKFEDPDYQLWFSKQGEHLVGTNIISPGPSGKTDGYYYTPTNSGIFSPDPSKDLKYKVGVAKFIAQDVNAKLVPFEYEFLDYTNLSNTYIGGELVFQDYGNTAGNVTFYKPGTLLVNSNSNTVIGVGTNFTTSVAQNTYIVLTDGSVGNTSVKKVLYVTNNTVLVLEDAPPFSNAVAKYKVTAVAKVYFPRYTQNNMVLIDSNANSTVRFVNNAIRTALLSTGGEGYTNSDYFVFSAGGSTANAAANVVTDANGTIISLNFSNTGLGFTSDPTITTFSSNVSITNAATIVCNTTMIGSTLKGSISGATANIANVTVHNVDQFRPEVYFDIPTDTSLSMTHLFTYEDSGYFTNSAFTANTELLKVNEITDYKGLLMSRSLEVINTSGLYNNDKSAVFNVRLQTTRSNTNLFVAPYLSSRKLDIFTFWNDINNDSTNEHTSHGNAVTKHISSKINFANNKFAEDIRVYLTAYKPANTDIEVYARIHNSADIEAFDDKDWTPLELKEGVGLLSSKADKHSYVELGYGFPQTPRVANTLAGVVSSTLSSATLNGTGTDFVTDLAANDLIKIYNPIFPANYQVAVVGSITNTTQIILKSVIANNGLSGAGFKISKLALKNVGFNNIQNDNVVRYHSSSMVEYDTYDKFQIKIVLLADNRKLVPRVDDIRAIGVSA